MKTYLETLCESAGVDYRPLSEKAPPGKKAARFLKKAKGDFKKRYGDDWKSRLYAVAWKLFG